VYWIKLSREHGNERLTSELHAEANTRASRLEIPRLLWKSETRCDVYEIAPLISIPIQMPSHPDSLEFILTLPFHLCLALPREFFRAGFSTKIL
jgi:hypothetical protein